MGAQHGQHLAVVDLARAAGVIDEVGGDARRARALQAGRGGHVRDHHRHRAPEAPVGGGVDQGLQVDCRAR